MPSRLPQSQQSQSTSPADEPRTDNPLVDKVLESLQNQRNGTTPHENVELFESSTERSQDLKQAIDAVFDIANIEMRTILSTEQLLSVNSMLTYSDYYRQRNQLRSAKLVLDIAVRLMKLRISGSRKKDGSGREDMLQALRSALAPTESPETIQTKNLKKLLS